MEVENQVFSKTNVVTVNRLRCIPESPVLYEELTESNIEFVARSYNQMNEETMAHAMELVELSV